MNHVLVAQPGHVHVCERCCVSWKFLTERDWGLLSRKGKCLGAPEQWRPCKVTVGKHCIGRSPEHKDCLAQ